MMKKELPINGEEQEKGESRSVRRKNPTLTNPYCYAKEALRVLDEIRRDITSEHMTSDQEENESMTSLDQELRKAEELTERQRLEEAEELLTRRARDLRKALIEKTMDTGGEGELAQLVHKEDTGGAAHVGNVRKFRELFYLKKYFCGNTTLGRRETIK